MLIYKGKYSTARVMTDSLDEASSTQIANMLNSPAICNPVVVMPDAHAGAGSVIGFTMEAGDKIIPNIVGVDIGCGMLSAQIDVSGVDIKELDGIVRRAIPLGFNVHDRKMLHFTDEMSDLADLIGTDRARFERSLGTLGGGNHFIEFGKDENGDTWVTIHTGSRKFGYDVAKYYQTRAGKGDLAYLEGSDSKEYYGAMMIAASFAIKNRRIILEQISHSLKKEPKFLFECVHNYIDSDMIIRKGAVRAYNTDNIILPFNREEGIWILKGKGNPDWNFSAPHGAGRVMGRKEAKRTFSQEEVDERMNKSGVYSSHNPIDESPMAYKDPKLIQEAIGETATFMFAIKPFLNIKG